MKRVWIWTSPARPLSGSLRRIALYSCFVVVVFFGLQAMYRDVTDGIAARRHQQGVEALLGSQPAKMTQIVVWRDLGRDEHGNAFPSRYRIEGLPSVCGSKRTLIVDAQEPNWCAWNMIDTRSAELLLKPCPGQPKRFEEMTCFSGPIAVRGDSGALSLGSLARKSTLSDFIGAMVFKHMWVLLGAFGVSILSTTLCVVVLSAIYGDYRFDEDEAGAHRPA